MVGSKGGWILYLFLAMVFIATVLTVGLMHEPPQLPRVVHKTVPTKEVPQKRTCFSSFETGIVFPRWTTSGYSQEDTAFTKGLPVMKAQTGSCWLEVPLLFKMSAENALTLDTGSAPSVTNFTSGLVLAHQLGFHLFVVPLITVSIPGGWAGSVRFHSLSGETQWFQAFWETYRPYIEASQAQHVEQLSIGTELSWMEQHAPQSLWQQYISKVTHVFSGKLTYDLNWSTLGNPLSPWMRSLSTLGVSEYIPLIDRPWRIAPPAMEALFRSQVKVKLDTLSQALGKPIIISEIGYRNSFDALYQPWASSGHKPADQEEQAAMVQTALSVLTADSHIAGTFFWAWHDSGEFDLEGTQAVSAIGNIYGKLEKS